MSAYQITYFLSLLIFTPLLTVGQKATNFKTTNTTIDLAGKTFIMREEADTSKAGNGLNLYLIFHKDSKATFRVKRGDTILKDNLLSWHLVNDSLYVQNSPIELIAGGKTQLIDRDPTKYAIKKASNGYLLKEKEGEVLWLEIK